VEHLIFAKNALRMPMIPGCSVYSVLWFYEHDPFPLVQCFWPDKESRLPWEDGCDDYVKNAQPLLYIP